MTDLNLLLKHTARSLYLSARLLPNSIREAFCISYLLCRYADTIADTPLLPPQDRVKYIQSFPSWIVHKQTAPVQQITDKIASNTQFHYEEKLLRNFPLCLTAFEKLPSLQQEAALQVVHAVCKGMEIDLSTFPAETSGQVVAFARREDLENYCHLMGGAPGIFWSQLITLSTPLPTQTDTFLSLGQDIGDALQIVNILRDLPRDLRIGRCYFPQEELQTYHLTAQDLLQATNADRFEPIKQKWIHWGRQKLQSAHNYMRALPKTQMRHRAAVAWPALWAADTLNKLEQEKNLLDPAVRVKISRYRIYGTMALTPSILLSNFLFSKWLNSKFPS